MYTRDVNKFFKTKGADHNTKLFNQVSRGEREKLIMFGPMYKLYNIDWSITINWQQNGHGLLRKKDIRVLSSFPL